MDGIGAHNRQRFDAADVVSDYAQAHSLTDCELELFGRNVPSSSRVLDLGVGTGRTTPWLSERSSTYLGIDYAPAMIESARRLHPGVDLRVGDAADLATVPSSSVDVVVFSYNGLDYLSDDARARCLAEVRRVLASSGVFLFSTHNPRAVLVAPPRSYGSRPRRLLVAMLTSARRMARMLPSRTFWTGEGWTLDPARGGLRTHMATPAKVATELSRAGFALQESLQSDFPRQASTFRTPWWYYAAHPTD